MRYLLILFSLVGCATQPMTAEEAERWQRAADAMGQFSNQMEQNSQRNYDRMSHQSPIPATCQTFPNGFGGYRVECY